VSYTLVAEPYSAASAAGDDARDVNLLQILNLARIRSDPELPGPQLSLFTPEVLAVEEIGPQRLANSEARRSCKQRLARDAVTLTMRQATHETLGQKRPKRIARRTFAAR
jgi:hypothetical protein